MNTRILAEKYFKIRIKNVASLCLKLAGIRYNLRNNSIPVFIILCSESLENSVCHEMLYELKVWFRISSSLP